MPKKLDVMKKLNEEQEYKTLINNDQRDINDELSMLVVNELFNKKNRKTMSRIKFEQVSIITKLFLFADTFGSAFTRKIGNHMLDLQISTNGLGRKESVQMIQQRTDIFDMGQMQKKSKDIFR